VFAVASEIGLDDVYKQQSSQVITAVCDDGGCLTLGEHLS
jgi:hypothetical protein